MAQLGKYQLVAEIARGGMGIVYLAVARGPARFNKLLVLKQLKPELVEDSNFLEMFLEEARLAARLNHPNIVQTYEIGHDDDKHYMVMDYLEGVTLARVLKRKKEAFTLGMHLRVLCEALQGLHYAHQLQDFDGTHLGIVHRDATPQNLFVTYDGQIKVVDFGIAKALDSNLETKTGVLKGKPSYMAPEQIAGDVDPRADVFTIGVMVWEAVTGHRMWSKKSDVEILTNIIKGELPKVTDEIKDAPPELVRIIEKSLQKDRDARYATAAEMQADLEKYLADSKTDVSLREIGKVVTEIFATERQSVKSTIEKHLAAVANGVTQAKLPSIRPPPPSESTDGGTPVSGARQSEQSLPTGATPAGIAAGSFSPMPSLAPAQSRTKMFAIMGAVAVAAIIITVIAMKSGGKPEVANATPPSTPVSSAAGANAAPEAKAAPMPTGPSTHEVAVKAYPKTAVVTIDGVEVSNPVTRRCNDGEMFTVHASMIGHVSQDRSLQCDKDQAIEIALTSAPAGYVPPKPKPSQNVSATAASTPAPPPTSDIGAGGTRPNRPIDTSSPYK